MASDYIDKEGNLSETTAKSEISRIASRIEALCEASEKANGPYYVAALGLDLGEDLGNIKKLTKLRLTEFIKVHLDDKFEVARLGEHGNVLAVVRRGAPLPVAQHSEDGFIRDSQGRPKFHYRFWAAFSVPPSAEHRYLNLDSMTFDDTDADVFLSGQIEIPKGYIPETDLPRRDDVIWENVQKWLQENDLPAERFFAKAGRVSKVLSRDQSSAGTNLLEAFLNSLDRRQLQNTSLSLDVVLTLLQNRR